MGSVDMIYPGFQPNTHKEHNSHLELFDQGSGAQRLGGVVATRISLGIPVLSSMPLPVTGRHERQQWPGKDICRWVRLASVMLFSATFEFATYVEIKDNELRLGTLPLNTKG